jgi:hypothetical protein
MPRVNPSDEIDTVAYAVSFMKAAKRLAEGEEEWEDNHSLIVPFYMLIGFSLENALKAVLEFNGSDPGTKWSHSHDLQKLRLLAEHHDFVLSDDLREFVDHLSPLHKDHHFRYPQKAETTHLLKPIAATESHREVTCGSVLGHRRRETHGRPKGLRPRTFSMTRTGLVTASPHWMQRSEIIISACAAISGGEHFGAVTRRAGAEGEGEVRCLQLRRSRVLEGSSGNIKEGSSALLKSAKALSAICAPTLTKRAL